MFLLQLKNKFSYIDDLFFFFFFIFRNKHLPISIFFWRYFYFTISKRHWKKIPTSDYVNIILDKSEIKMKQQIFTSLKQTQIKFQLFVFSLFVIRLIVNNWILIWLYQLMKLLHNCENHMKKKMYLLKDLFNIFIN